MPRKAGTKRWLRNTLEGQARPSKTWAHARRSARLLAQKPKQTKNVSYDGLTYAGTSGERIAGVSQ